MIYLQLFISFFQIGLFSIGGGYAALPLIQEQVVANHQWLTNLEYTDLITISQMTPGPIAINSATFVGDQIAGFGDIHSDNRFLGREGGYGKPGRFELHRYRSVCLKPNYFTKI